MTIKYLSKGALFFLYSALASVCNYSVIAVLSNRLSIPDFATYSVFEIIFSAAPAILSLGIGYSIIKISAESNLKVRKILINYSRNIFPLQLMLMPVIGLVFFGEIWAMIGLILALESVSFVFISAIRVKSLGVDYASIILIRSIFLMVIVGVIALLNDSLELLMVVRVLLIISTAYLILCVVKCRDILFITCVDKKAEVIKFSEMISGMPFLVSSGSTLIALWLERQLFINANLEINLAEGYIYFKYAQILQVIYSPIVAWLPSILFSKNDFKIGKLIFAPIIIFVSGLILIIFGTMFHAEISNFFKLPKYPNIKLLSINVAAAFFLLSNSILSLFLLRSNPVLLIAPCLVGLFCEVVYMLLNYPYLINYGVGFFVFNASCFFVSLGIFAFRNRLKNYSS